MLLGFGATIAHAAEAVEAHGAGQRIARFALVQFRSGTPAQLRRSAISTAVATMRSMTEGPGAMNCCRRISSINAAALLPWRPSSPALAYGCGHAAVSRALARLARRGLALIWRAEARLRERGHRYTLARKTRAARGAAQAG